MPNELPTFAELLAAQQTARGQGPAQAALTGINEGVNLGRSILEKNREEEERKRQFQMKVQQALLEKRKVDLGAIPAAKSLTGAESSPEVQKVLTPETPKPIERAFQMTPDEVIAFDKATGRPVARTPITPKGKGGTGGADLKQLDFLAANAVDQIQQIKKTLGVTKTGEIPLKGRALLLPGAQRGLIPGVSADDASAVDKRLFNTVTNIVKLYQGSRPSDFDIKAYLEFIRPKGMSLASGKGETEILDDLEDGLKVMVALRQGKSISPSDPAYAKFQRLAGTLGLFSKTADPTIEQAVGGTPSEEPGSSPITAVNPNTGERIQSLDGGQTWQPVQ